MFSSRKGSPIKAPDNTSFRYMNEKQLLTHRYFRKTRAGLRIPGLGEVANIFCELGIHVTTITAGCFCELVFWVLRTCATICELVFWGFANLRNYFANLCFGVLRTCATILRTCVLGFARVKLVRDADRHVLRQIPSIGIGAQHGRSHWTFAMK